MRIPIACTLTATDAGDRVEEWRTFLRAHVVGVERQPTVARLRLADGDEVLLAAADLARREVNCCSFFRFRLEPRPEGLWLEVAVPPEAIPVLDDLAGLLEPSP